MTKYELVVILSSNLDEAKIKTLTQKISGLITAFKAEDIKISLWGKKTLAYTIKKNKDGTYLQYNFLLSASKASSLAAKIKSEENIIRYLLLRKE